MRNKVSGVLLLIMCVASAFDGERDATIHTAVFPAVRFILQLGVLVLAAKIGGRLFHRWHLPRVLGEIGAGLLVGPFLLGGIALPLFPDGLMSDAVGLFGSQGPVYGVLTLSLVVYFFMVGLDTDLQQLRRAQAGGVAAGLGGFALSFAAMLVVLDKVAPALAGVDGWTWASPQVLLLGVIVSVTSLGMLGRMLAERQRLESPAGSVALTAALTDNVAGLFLLTAASGVAAAAAAGAEPSLRLLASMAVRALLGFGVIALCGFPIARYVNGLALREKNYTSAFAVSAACLLIAGGAMGAMGLSVVGGAYMMGVAFSTTDLRHEIHERLDFVGVVLLPACFAAVGMQVDPRLLADVPTAVSVGLIVAGVVLAKLAGGAVPAAFAGLNGVGCLRVGVASLPRGEISVAMLAVALGLVALPPGVVAAAVALVVVTCGCGPFLANRAFAGGGSGTRKDYVAPAPVKIVFQFPSHQAAMVMISRAVEIFEDDGFYAHRLNRHQVLYRISRESQVIHLHGREGEVTFECSERERPLINTVMLELSSGVEQSLRELQKPLDDVLLRKSMQSAAPATAAAVASGMLRNRFAIETLKPHLLATTKQGAISELVSLLYEKGLVMDRERAVQAVFEREQSISTGLEYGLAIPHARTDAVTRLVCAVGIKKEGLDFDALDGKPTRIVALVLAPDSAATPQLQLIAQLCRLLNEQGRAALLACETAEDMFGVLTVGAGSALAAAHGKRPSPLPACLQWQSISLEMAPVDQPQALSLLLALCARSGAVGAVEEVRKELLAVPSPVPEKVGDEVALFALATPNVYRTVAALGVSAQGVAYAGGRCRVWVMVLSPPSAAADVIRVKDALTHALDPQGLAALLAAKTSKEALDVLLKT
jgi:Kef-type K+ transport system membrane component KefB/mannitol/fructose-specific phosphotransferase system IIA component (Ntr-type)